MLETWESLGVNNGPQLLSELGFTKRGHERLSLRDLAVALEEECRVGSERDGRGPAAVTSLHLAALSYLHEVKFLRYLYTVLIHMIDYFSPSSHNFDFSALRNWRFVRLYRQPSSGLENEMNFLVIVDDTH